MDKSSFLGLVLINYVKSEEFGFDYFTFFGKYIYLILVTWVNSIFLIMLYYIRRISN